MSFKVISVPGLTILALVEALAITSLLPDLLPSRNPFIVALLRFLAANYTLYAFYCGLVYPYFVCPLRHFPSLSVRLAFNIRRYLPSQPPGERFLDWSKKTTNDGVILLRSPFHKSRLLLTKPNALAEVLVSRSYDFVKPGRIRSFLRRALGNGLIVVEGEQHRFQRKNVMPAFSFRHIKDLYPMMWRKAMSFIDAVHEDSRYQNGVVEVNGWASKATLDIIGLAGLGHEFNVLKNSEDDLVKNYEELLEPSTEKVIYFLMHVFTSVKFMKALPWKLNKIFDQTTASLREICNNLVQEKRESLEKGGDDHFDLLSLLIKSNNFSNVELVDQLLTFLAAGHETTSSSFTWLAYLLATHHDVQKSLRKELIDALPSTLSVEAPDDLSQTLERLPLLNAVCNETLRLYPTVPITIRVAKRDTQIQNVCIPRATEIIISPWAVNRLPELWGPDADKFKPERWIDDGKPNNHGGVANNYANMTFLHGPRSCIGQNFAKAELRCLVAAFVRAFEFEMDGQEQRVIPAGVVTIKPKFGLKLKLKCI